MHRANASQARYLPLQKKRCRLSQQKLSTRRSNPPIHEYLYAVCREWLVPALEGVPDSLSAQLLLKATSGFCSAGSHLEMPVVALLSSGIRLDYAGTKDCDLLQGQSPAPGSKEKACTQHGYQAHAHHFKQDSFHLCAC